MGKSELFLRFSKNPIITVEDIPYTANSVFNAGATLHEGLTLLLMRVEDRTGISHLALAKSEDGKRDWHILDKPFMSPDPARWEDEYGIEDPRITYIPEKELFAIVFTSFSPYGPLVSLATTYDFEEIKRWGVILPPENKDAAFFPERIDNQFTLIHRPVSSFPQTKGHIWMGRGPDLTYLGEHRILLEARDGSFWDSSKIGIGPPPLKTEKGWLILYHGVKDTVSGPIYRLGLALLDLNRPWVVLKRPKQWIFGPTTPYELIGDVDKVVFPCGWVLSGDELRLYYGVADKAIALATASLRELLDWLEAQD